MKEYELLQKYNNHEEKLYANGDHVRCFELLKDLLSHGKGYEFLNLPVLRKKTEEILQFLDLQQKYILLHEKYNNISLDNQGFNLDGHRFDTLDELEKALKNKAFL